jgi:hypothetical protein
VDVVDSRGHHTKPGAEVRVYKAGSYKLISPGLVDTGGGYCSQSVAPVHVATAGVPLVDVEVTSMSRAGRRVTKCTEVNPATASRPLIVRAP